MSASENENIFLNITTDEYFGEYLKNDSINEICYQGGDLIWYEDIYGVWHCEKSAIDFKKANSFAQSCASFKDDKIDTDKPILSCILPTGERVQILIPPAVKNGIVSITIRKPSKTRYYLYEDYVEKMGSLDKNTADFIVEAVKSGKNIVICGETGSGKTTFMKTIIDYIPVEERLITIEDVEEIKFYNHKNFVQLFYPSEAKKGDPVTSSNLLKSCLRMKPSRILLAEVRGGETYDFLNVISSGHNGSITSCHAGSVSSCINRLIMMAMQNDEARVLGRDMILNVVKSTIDMIIVFKRENSKRQITEYLYDGKFYKKNDDGIFSENRDKEIFVWKL